MPSLFRHYPLIRVGLLLFEPSCSIVAYGLTPTCYHHQEHTKELLRSHYPFQVVRVCLSTEGESGALSRCCNPDSLYLCRLFPTQGRGLFTTSLLPLATLNGGSYDTSFVLPIDSC
ncbi:MAG: hypothetical protein V7K77_03760 [Nostoc sp.]|uniref:hypothetical protein n=1 Tax=Nostoc sp. TaxID=1180 RepID=UPI002FFB466E